MQYSIPIQRSKIKQKQVTSMHLIAGFMYIILGIFIWAVPNLIKNDTDAFIAPLYQTYSIIGLVLIVITLFFNRKLSNPKLNIPIRILEIVLFLIIIAVSAIKSWWVPLAYGGAGLVAVILTLRNEINAAKPELVLVSKDSIVIPQNINNVIKWEELKNFILKHGNITIDKRNNKLIQYAIKNPRNISNLDEIEKFGKEQIELNKHKHQEDW